MADEQTEQTQDQATDTQPDTTTETQETKVEDTQPETQETSEGEGDPHPLDPGGKRFSEVYRDMRESQREVLDLRTEVDRLKGAQQQPKEVWFNADQLQSLANEGRITQAQMADQLAWQRATLQSRQDAQQRQAETVQLEAKREIDQYTAKVPALLTPGSAELVRVGRAASEIGRELGLPVTDLRVQKRALREVYGSPDKLSRVQTAREDARRNADTHSETGGGQRMQPKSKDPLVDVPQRYKDHWTKLGYTREQMVAEAKYIRPRR